MAQQENPGCLFAIFRLFGLKPRVAQTLPYRLRDDFLSPAEQTFYRALSAVIGDSAIIAPKVNLSDIFFVVKPNENRSFLGRIVQKHLDFLLCDPQTLRPLAGLELDDASHRRPDRQARDAFVDQVFQAAGLPLIHVPCRRDYERAEIEALLAGLTTDDAEAQPPAAAQPPDLPAENRTSASFPQGQAMHTCPKCGVPMVRRESARGAFYGCPNYPKCRQTAKVD